MFQVEYFENSTKLSNVKLTSDEPETQVKYAYFIEGGNTTIQQLYPPYIVSLWIKNAVVSKCMKTKRLKN